MSGSLIPYSMYCRPNRSPSAAGVNSMTASAERSIWVMNGAKSAVPSGGHSSWTTRPPNEQKTRPRRGFEKEIKEKLGIPDNVDTAALLPLGYPADGLAAELH